MHTHAHIASPCIKHCVIHKTLGGLASAADAKQEEGVQPAVRGYSHCARQPASKAGPPGCPERSVALRTEEGSCSLSGAGSMEGWPSAFSPGGSLFKRHVGMRGEEEGRC